MVPLWRKMESKVLIKREDEPHHTDILKGSDYTFSGAF